MRYSDNSSLYALTRTVRGAKNKHCVFAAITRWHNIFVYTRAPLLRWYAGHIMPDQQIFQERGKVLVKRPELSRMQTKRSSPEPYEYWSRSQSIGSALAEVSHLKWVGIVFIPGMFDRRKRISLGSLPLTASRFCSLLFADQASW